MHPEEVIAALRFEPLLPLWLIAALGVVALLIVGLAAFRRARGTVWRLAGFAVLLLWLAGPRIVQESRDNLPDIGLLVVDQTASMQVGERARLADAARAKLTEQAAKLPDLELRTVTVPEGGDAGTRLFGAVDRALADIPRSRLAGTIAITDGQVHDIPETPPGGAPLNVLVPAKGEETDRRLRVIEAPSYGIVGKTVTLRVAIEDLGVAHPAPSANLTIRRDGEPPRVENVPIGAEQRIELPITRAGPTVVELSATPLAGEVSTINDRAVVEINGVRDRLRVLLISGEPHPGERTWRRLLKADPSVDLVHFTILRPPEKDDLTPLNELALIAFPVRELFLDKIHEFDLIILDRFQNRGLLPMPYIANIADHVREGGALLLSVGPEFSGASSLAATPIGQVLPGVPASMNSAVVEDQFRPRVTDLGQRHPVTEGLSRGEPARQSRRGRGVGILVPPHSARRRARRGAAWHTGQPAVAAARPGRQGPRRAAAVGSDLAVVAWPSGGRAPGRAAAPRGALADAGTGAGRERAHGTCRQRAAFDRAPLDRPRASRPGDGDRPRRQDADPGPDRGEPRQGHHQSAGDDTGGLAGGRRRAHRLCGSGRREPARIRRSARHGDPAAQAGEGFRRCGALRWHRHAWGTARRAGPAPDGTGPASRRQLLDRPRAAA